MTKGKSKFVTLTKKKWEFVLFVDNTKGIIINQRNVGYGTSFLIENVLLIDGLKYNLLSITQLYD